MSIQNIERLLAVASAISCIISAGIMCQQVLAARINSQLNTNQVCVEAV